MGDRNRFQPIERFCTGGYVMNSVEYFCAVITCSTTIANTDRNTFEDYKTFLVLECLTVDFLRSNDSLAVFARIAVRSRVSGTC